MIYFLIIIWLAFLSYHFDIKGRTKNYKIWYYSVLIVLILLSGLRYRIGSDTPNYIDRFYHSYPSLENYSLNDYPIGNDPLYVLINSVVISIGGRFFILQLLQASFVIILIFNYIKKHCQFVFTCALVYFIMCYVQFNFEIMRASMSIAVSLYANDYALKKKWTKAYLLYFTAILFHIQAIFLTLVPLFLFLRLNRKGYLLLLVAFLGGLIVQRTFGALIELISFAEQVQTKGLSYADNEVYNNSGGNINFYIVHIFPALFYTLFSIRYIRKHCCSDKLLKLEPLAILGLIFLLIQMNIQIVSRYVDCFAIYMVMFIADCAVMLARRSKRQIHLATLNCALIFFPLVSLTIYQYKWCYERLIPYNSVINRKIDKAREIAIDNPMRPSADINEY